MAEQAIAEANASPNEEEELEPEPGDEAAAEPTTHTWAIRGAVVGAVAGSAVGAGVGILVARRPEALTQAKSAIAASGRQVARAAVGAATEAMAAQGLKELLAGDGNGRSRVVKQTAREAGGAAAKAARDEILSLRRKASD